MKRACDASGTWILRADGEQTLDVRFEDGIPRRLRIAPGLG
jgi:hypothetical protein